jgi:YspA, cpYpsA-related SLOG family
MQEEIVIICTGSRDYKNYEKVIDVLEQYDPKRTTLIHGGAKGLDEIVDIVGKYMGFTVRKYEAKWTHSKRDGILRNSEMLYEERPDKVIGWRSKLNSKGTNDMLMKAGHHGIPHEIYDDF